MLQQHEIELRVRYNETDPMGFLHHAHYFTYFEIGRTELLRAAGQLSPERRTAFWWSWPRRSASFAGPPSTTTCCDCARPSSA